ncbi:MAG: hypothetical protein ACREKL_00505 [Chthoniobacterales bacterium]
MNNRASVILLVATGGLLIAGMLAAIFSTTRYDATAVKLVFENSGQPAQPVPEPLFPGQP